jgi:hypothetical protein
VRRVPDVFEILRAIFPRRGQHDLSAARVVVHERRHVVHLACDGVVAVVAKAGRRRRASAGAILRENRIARRTTRDGRDRPNRDTSRSRGGEDARAMDRAAHRR